MMLGVLIALGLVLYGLTQFPSTSIRSLLGVIILLVLYGFLGWKGPAILLRQPPIVATVAVLAHEFPAAFSAYWLRVKSAAACRATAELTYD